MPELFEDLPPFLGKDLDEQQLQNRVCSGALRGEEKRRDEISGSACKNRGSSYELDFCVLNPLHGRSSENAAVPAKDVTSLISKESNLPVSRVENILPSNSEGFAIFSAGTAGENAKEGKASVGPMNNRRPSDFNSDPGAKTVDRIPFAVSSESLRTPLLPKSSDEEDCLVSCLRWLDNSRK